MTCGSAIVLRRLTVWLDGLRIPVEATLTYRAADPYAVLLVLADPGAEAVPSWRFARELAIDGLAEPRGDDRVLVGPHEADDEWIVLTLDRPRPGDEPVTVLAERADLDAFVAASCALVPVGREAGRVDAELERLLPQLLGGTS